MRKARLALASLAVGLAVACSSAGTFSNIGNNLDSSRAVAPAPAGQAGGSVGYGPDSAAKQGQGESSSGVLGVLFQSDKVLILTAQLQLRSADPWAVSKKVQQVASTVRAQIEQLQGQLNALKNRSAMATITTSVSTTPILPSPIETGWQPQRTFQAAVAALGGMLRVFADVAIWALVWSWLPLLALGFLYVLSRRVRTAA